MPRAGVAGAEQLQEVVLLSAETAEEAHELELSPQQSVEVKALSLEQ